MSEPAVRPVARPVTRLVNLRIVVDPLRGMGSPRCRPGSDRSHHFDGIPMTTPALQPAGPVAAREPLSPASAHPSMPLGAEDEPNRHSAGGAQASLPPYGARSHDAGSPALSASAPLSAHPKTMQEYREYLLSIMPPGQKPGPWLAFRNFEERRTRR